jgi:hypothetical protein
MSMRPEPLRSGCGAERTTPENEVRQQSQPDDADDSGHGIGLDGPTGAQRTLRSDLSEEGTFASPVVHQLVRSFAGHMPCVMSDVLQVTPSGFARLYRTVANASH